MKTQFAIACALLTTVLVVMAEATESNRHVSLRSTYLAAPLEGYRQLTLIGDLDDAGGRGTLVLDPNECALNDFGDRGSCTEIKETERTVLQRLRRDDPSGMKRQLWVVEGALLPGVLCLVVPEDRNGPHRLIYQSRGGERTVIGMEPFVYQKNPGSKGPSADHEAVGQSKMQGPAENHRWHYCTRGNKAGIRERYLDPVDGGQETEYEHLGGDQPGGLCPAAGILAA